MQNSNPTHVRNTIETRFVFLRTNFTSMTPPDVMAEKLDKSTPLHDAAAGGHVETAQVLLATMEKSMERALVLTLINDSGIDNVNPHQLHLSYIITIDYVSDAPVQFIDYRPNAFTRCVKTRPSRHGSLAGCIGCRDVGNSLKCLPFLCSKQ
jgi:hypothetical protein